MAKGESKPTSNKPAGKSKGASADAAPASPYVVLARKYRPSDFSDLVGQDAMVQTLGNAFKTGRIHHAFILTGVRGVGKTTTARILARAFNYVDSSGPHPTLDLATEGQNCRAIIEGRHVDVVEMDAASHTQVDNIRENIIDSVQYGPVSAPYKVFIIDEVHMLSNSSFNALLKTLEEPPPYVKFIFATTEIRKVPVTILSRCQRFDLRRIDPETMTGFLTGILDREGVGIEPDALTMIVRAGEGSARDCLSLLDQAISHGGGEVSAQSVRAMLGLADRAAILDLFEMLMTGDIAAALTRNRALYDAGADAQAILTDLADVTHLVTRLKLVPAGAKDQSLTPDERQRGPEFAARLGMRSLTRTWQILLKGIDEVAHSDNAIQAAEMVLIRLTHAADLPTPDEIIDRLQNQSATSPATPPSRPPPSGNGGGGGGGAHAHARLATVPRSSAPATDPAPRASAAAAPRFAMPESYPALVALAAEKRDLAVKHALESDLRPLSFAEGRIEVQLTERADPSIIATLSARLQTWTGRAWMVIVSSDNAEAPPTIREQRRAAEQAERDNATDDPLIQAIFDTFPGAKLVNVTIRDDINPETEGLPPADDDDPGADDQNEDM